MVKRPSLGPCPTTQADVTGPGTFATSTLPPGHLLTPRDGSHSLCRDDTQLYLLLDLMTQFRFTMAKLVFRALLVPITAPSY